MQATKITMQETDGVRGRITLGCPGTYIAVRATRAAFQFSETLLVSR